MASSAPVGNYDPEGWASHAVDEYTFSDIIVDQYDKTPGCLQAIWDATDVINSAPQETLVEAFNLCDATGLGNTSHSDLFLYGLEGLPQMNYPYQIGSMPAWPVDAVCQILLDNTSDPVTAAATATSIALSYPLTGDCYPTLDEGPGNVPGDGPGAGPWGYQSCTETLHLFSSRGREDGGIREYDFDWDVVSSICTEYWSEYDVQPNPNAFTERYGGETRRGARRRADKLV